jgi:hypothetical protein
VTAPLYDVQLGLAEARRARLTRHDAVTVETGRLADKLAVNMARHFTPAERKIAGRALLIAGASVGVFEDIPPAVVANLVAFAGERLMRGDQT